jgi:hypothetical protein
MLNVSLRPQAGTLRAGGDVRWDLQVTNDGVENVVLTFMTSQLGDVVLERGGIERYRWSEGLLFGQVVSERSLGPGETWAVALEGSLDVEPGQYEATGTLACQPRPPVARARVVVASA